MVDRHYGYGKVWVYGGGLDSAHQHAATVSNPITKEHGHWADCTACVAIKEFVEGLDNDGFEIVPKIDALGDPPECPNLDDLEAAHAPGQLTYSCASAFLKVIAYTRWLQRQLQDAIKRNQR